MYISELIVRNNGPISDVRIEFARAPNDDPLPYLMVGTNGSGKTNLLSIIVDALYEGAASAYQDVAPIEGLGRSWFRLIGGKTISIGTQGGYAVAKFTEGNDTYLYTEKGGIFDPTVALTEVGNSYASVINWSTDGAFKTFGLPIEAAKRIYAEGAYAYFPASRSEIPHWLNRTSLPEQKFDTSGGLSSKLGKPLFVERGLDSFAQWVMSVILDARIDPSEVSRVLSNASLLTGQFNAAIAKSQMDTAAAANTTLTSINALLRVITNRRSARFVWLGREHAQKVSIAEGDALIAAGLDGLSGGQATLLNVFGTLIRYGDRGTGASVPIGEISGICVIDEVDAHMHVDLQVNVLPSLIRMFPKIQFILSGHSPFFIMGMEKTFGKDGFRVIDIPSGNMVEPENYEELGQILKLMLETTNFQKYIDNTVAFMSQPKVWFEGETDPIYFKTAAALHGLSNILDLVEMEWIGAKDPNSGQGFNTGKDALDKASNLLTAKPNLVKNHVILVYDCDANKTDKDVGNIHVRGIPFNSDNTLARKGVENLLPVEVFSEEMYDKTTKTKDYGGSVTTSELNKMRLCANVCDKKKKEDFHLFIPVLEEILKIVTG